MSMSCSFGTSRAQRRLATVRICVCVCVCLWPWLHMDSKNNHSSIVRQRRERERDREGESCSPADTVNECTAGMGVGVLWFFGTTTNTSHTVAVWPAYAERTVLSVPISRRCRWTVGQVYSVFFLFFSVFVLFFVRLQFFASEYASVRSFFLHSLPMTCRWKY